MSDEQPVNDPQTSFETEREVYGFLWQDIKRLKISAAGSLSIVVGASLVYACSSEWQSGVAVGAGLLGTYAAFVVALAVYRWSRRSAAKTLQHLLDIRENTEQQRKAAIELRGAESERPEDDEDIEERDPLANGLNAQDMHVGHTRYVFYPSPYEHDMAWWQRLLTRVKDASNSDEESSKVAQELLSNPIDRVVAVGFPADKQRGNRRTLLLTEHEGDQTVWSVFSGKGKRVEKL